MRAPELLKHLFYSDVMYGYLKSNTFRGRLDGTGKDLLEFIASFEYSEFRGSAPAALANCLRKLIRRGIVLSFQFGREYSPVLYVEVSPLRRRDRIQEGENCLLTPKGQRNRTHLVFGALKRAGKPDEATIVTAPVIGENERMEHLGRIRLWWD